MSTKGGPNLLESAIPVHSVSLEGKAENKRVGKRSKRKKKE